MAPRMAVRPFKSVMRTPALIGARPKRRTAAEASRAARRGRNSTPRVRPRSAASCKRRISRAFGRRAHARTASQAPEPSACSRAHNGRAPLTTATRSRAMPSAASAGAKGIRGGATHTHHRAHRARVRAASAGNSRYSSPLPKRGTRISIRPARGQPLPGRHASSAANPLASPSACAALAPRQMVGCSSKRASCAEEPMRAHEPCTRSHKAARAAPAHHAHHDAFDEQRLFFQIHPDRLELGVLRQEPHDGAFLAVTLHRHLVLEPRDHDLAAAHLGGAMHGDPASVEDPGILHAHAGDPKEVMLPWLTLYRVDLQPRLEVLFGENGLAGGY